MWGGESKESVDPSLSPEEQPMEGVGKKGLNTEGWQGGAGFPQGTWQPGMPRAAECQWGKSPQFCLLLFILVCFGKQNLSLIPPVPIPTTPLLGVLGVL